VTEEVILFDHVFLSIGLERYYLEIVVLLLQSVALRYLVEIKYFAYSH